MQIVILVVLLGLMWVVLILPRQRELRRHNQLMSELAVGDEVMTGAGIYGVITDIDAEHVQLRIAHGVVVKVARRAVAAKVTEPEQEPGSARDLAEGIESTESTESTEAGE